MFLEGDVEDLVGCLDTFACAELSPAGTAGQSAHEATEDVFGARTERNYHLNVRRRARAESARDLDCGASLTALAECDGVRATLVGARLTSRAFRAVSAADAADLKRLSAQLRVSDARFCESLTSERHSSYASSL